MDKKLKEFKVHYLQELPSDENSKQQIKNKIGIKPTKIREENDFKKSTFSKIFKPLMISGSAFILGISCLIFIVSMVSYQNIPVYQGMSAENFLNDKVYLSGEGNYSDYIEDEIGVEVDNKIVCYAKPNEEIIVSIKIDNPKPYEILSFTLNGILYQSYEFLEGSNSTNIFVKFVVQKTSGIQKITIDAIKYIKNTSIKNARFNGEKEIKLGITYDEAPSVNMENVVLNENNLALDLNLTDSNNLVSDKGFMIYLFDETDLISSKQLHNGENSVQFTNLKLDCEYYYAIVGVFDLYDGAGKKAYILLDGSFNTLTGLSYKDVNITHNSITFDYDVIEFLDIVIKDISIYLEDELIDQIHPSKENFIFSGLMSNTEYSIKTTYEYPYGDEVVKEYVIFTFNTKEVTPPSVTFVTGVGVYSTIYSDILVEDKNNLISYISVELYLENTLVETKEISEFDTSNGDVIGHVTFSGVQRGEYLLVVCYKYNLNDGKGDIVINKDTLDVDNTLIIVLD